MKNITPIVVLTALELERGGRGEEGVGRGGYSGTALMKSMLSIGSFDTAIDHHLLLLPSSSISYILTTILYQMRKHTCVKVSRIFYFLHIIIVIIGSSACVIDCLRELIRLHLVRVEV